VNDGRSVSLEITGAYDENWCPAETARALSAQGRPRVYPHALHGRHLRCASGTRLPWYSWTPVLKMKYYVSQDSLSRYSPRCQKGKRVLGRPRLPGPAETARALSAQGRPRVYPHALHGRHLRCVEDEILCKSRLTLALLASMPEGKESSGGGEDGGDCQVPPKLLERCPRKDDREFTHMRYTAATCDVRQAYCSLRNSSGCA
jgi:hypothetical protein